MEKTDDSNELPIEFSLFFSSSTWSAYNSLWTSSSVNGSYGRVQSQSTYIIDALQQTKGVGVSSIKDEAFRKTASTDDLCVSFFSSKCSREKDKDAGCNGSVRVVWMERPILAGEGREKEEPKGEPVFILDVEMGAVDGQSGRGSLHAWVILARS